MCDEIKKDDVFIWPQIKQTIYFNTVDPDKWAEISNEGELIFFDEDLCRKTAKQFDEGMRDCGYCAAKIVACIIDKHKKELGDMIAKEFGNE